MLQAKLDKKVGISNYQIQRYESTKKLIQLALRAKAANDITYFFSLESNLIKRRIITPAALISLKNSY